MRVALLSDIHGNPLALDAVLADVAAQGGADEYWVLGDLAALGPEPVATLERLAALPRARFVRGNTDRYVVTGVRPEPTLETVRAQPELLPRLLEVATSFAWTQGVLTQAGWLDWLAALPLELRETLPNGTRVLGVHAAPGLDEGPGLTSALSPADFVRALDGCQADLVVVGHTHAPLDLTIAGYHVVNLGSVSNAQPPDLRASYGLLAADRSGYHLQLRRVDYDRAAVIAALERVRHPAAGFIIRQLRGERRTD